MNNDLISRSELKKAFEKVYPLAINEMGGVANKRIYDIIDNAPTVPLPDFKEGYKQAILDGKTNYSRPEGKWIDGFMSVVYCNKCHSQYRNHAKSYNYCPNCGAEMKGSKNEQYTI